REAGIPVHSAEADRMRQTATAIAGQTRELNRQIDAWDKVRSAGEGAIDSIVDKLASGDIGSALESVASDFQGMLLEMAVKNPLKNAIFGADNGTLADVGGLGGIWDRLTGATDTRTPEISSKSMDVGAMTVTAASVTILGGLIGGGAANVNGSGLRVPGVSTGPITANLPGSEAVQDQAWQFFASKGLKPHQIAGIMGNVTAESGFNPAAIGDGGTSFGLFQHHAGRGQGLLDALGGQGKLGNVSGQLDYVWKELQTSEKGVLQKLMASNDVREATGAFASFERPQGWSAANPEGAMHFDKRLDAAQKSVEKFGTSANAATENLGTLGSGFDAFGNALLSGLQGGGGINGILGSLAGSLAGAIGIPGFSAGAATTVPAKGYDIGGATGGSDPNKIAGFVHEKEYVFDAKSTARIGVSNLEAIRKGVMGGYRKGGYASSGQTFPNNVGDQRSNDSGGFGKMAIVVNDYSGQNVEAEVQPDGRGGRQMLMSIGQQGAAAMAQPGNPMNKQLARLGAKKGPTQR
ncbi:MAG: phage tail tip lysozyme, partial [Rhodobacterales bacterium]